MKKYFALSIFLGAISAQAIQSPAQQSAGVVNAVVASILADTGLQFQSISKITVRSGNAKAQLLDQNGDCIAIPYVVETSALGDIRVDVNEAARAICD